MQKDIKNYPKKKKRETKLPDILKITIILMIFKTIALVMDDPTQLINFTIDALDLLIGSYNLLKDIKKHNEK